MIYQPPFEPTIVEAEAIINVGFMFADIAILFILITLMIYLYKKINDILPIIVVYLFSLLIGMEGISHFHTHFSPILEIFFLLFQSTIFIMASIDSFKINKRRKNSN